ncbi:MAG: glycosyltransferase family 4 protein [Henriciella sp.]
MQDAPPAPLTRLRMSMLRVARSLWARIPESWRYRMWTIAGPRWQSAYARSMIARPAQYRPSNPEAPLVVAGLFSTANGIGEAARTTYRALQAAGLNPIAVDLSEPFAPVDLTSEIPCQQMPDDQEGTLILQLNGPETMSAMQHLGLERGRNWYTIGYWAWELPTFPTGWEKAFRYLSELWTISTFTADALRKHPDAPDIHVFGHAVAPPKGVRPARMKFGWKKDQLIFLTMADSMSSFERKNPIATIRAFRAAFGEDPSKRLIVKTRNLARSETAMTNLTAAIHGAQNIEILDTSLSEKDQWALLKSCDVLVSLHRSEGFGLGLAETMALGKPVICTDWSGNMDFTNETSAALVRSSLIPCEDEYGVYGDTSAYWADPDHEDAVGHMRRLAEDTEARRKLAATGKAHIEKLASASRTGQRMSDRLDEVPNAPDPAEEG